MDRELKNQEQNRRSVDRRFRKALAEHNRKVRTLTADHYQRLGDAAYRRARNFPDVLPDDARTRLAEAAAIHFAGPLPKRAHFL